MSDHEVGTTMEFKRRQSLEATVIRACKSCNAPGIYSAEERIKAWPGAFDLVLAGKPVGPVCPNCGAARPEDENRGEIWSKTT